MTPGADQLIPNAAAQPSLDQSFGYDGLGRLVSVVSASSSWSITYDANGNRTGVTLNGTPSGYTVAATSNRLTSVSNPTRSFVYDSAGNTTSAGSYTATYNLAGRLSTLSRAGVTTTYAVDGFGRRVRKFDSRGVTNTVLFVYDQQGQLLGEYSNTGAPIREYVWLGSTPVAMFVPNPAGATLQPIVYYVHTDHLDTPRALLDTAGNLRWTWLAEPFGNTAPNANPAGLGAVTMNLRHPGQYADAESGLFYNYFRDYDPSLGRYTQSDPIGLAGGINTYAYVGGNPISFVDPEGLMGRGSGGMTATYRPGDGPGSPFGQVGAAVGGAWDFARSFGNMMDATYWAGRAHNGWANQDKYFHCVANCAAAQRGAGGHAMACRISDGREWFDQNIKGDPPAASAADQVANAFGRSQGTGNPGGSCRQLCGSYRPGGSFPF
jgi:RHS repeat-associated protein